ncbi:TPA: hypothetical protein QDZ66_000632 [Pluralibacter gergoviae]|uniref:hypothetical protein n=1 Tax=Pluralibacter gergoviae TaxID=61647 RepID=UPI0006509F32|nr:hypothetical protein [Pluralibacter gergoviae]KMK20919.1 hypothetical protein ABW10_22165 [Pluralibacter gergoviae]MBL3694255.1 hypothetical protein [Pluralibacter gergoviae]HDS1149917.1 hypothetical protein [Pluralibacter gergoviae]
MCTGIEVALVASSVLAAGGAVAAGQQQKKMANYQANQAEADAEASRAAARVEAERIRKAGREQAAQANAALAGSGVETGAGTALRITSDITGDAEQDAYLTTVNGINTANRYQAQAQADRIGGRNAANAGYISAGSSLLSAGGKAYSGWKTAKEGKYGLFAE